MKPNAYRLVCVYFTPEGLQEVEWYIQQYFDTNKWVAWQEDGSGGREYTPAYGTVDEVVSWILSIKIHKESADERAKNRQ